MALTDLNLEKNQKPLFKTSKAGYEFNLYSHYWKISQIHVLQFKTNITSLPFNQLNSLRNALAYYAEFKSSAHTTNIFRELNNYLKYSEENLINSKSLINWKSNLLEENNEYKLGVIRGFLAHALDLGYPIISQKEVDELEQLSLKGNPTGVAVAKGCPHSGAFDHIEQQEILSWLLTNFESKTISLKQFSFSLTLMFTGRRPIQIGNLTFGDLIKVKRDDGTFKYNVNFPRAKQRGAKFREFFKKVGVNESLYYTLYNQALLSIKEVEAQLGETLSNDFKKNIPIYLNSKNLNTVSSREEYITKSKRTPDFFFISNTANITTPLFNLMEIKSARLNGDFINVFPRRFRITYATNLRKRGAGEIILAEALDHSSTNHVSVYTQMTGEFVDTLSSAMAESMAPLAQAFQGKLVDADKETFRRKDERSLIRSANAESVGNCGTYTFCPSGFLSCYTCRNFHPWIDAPHKEVLAYLEKKRAKQREFGVSELVISATDITLLAIKQVVSMCENANKDKSALSTVSNIPVEIK